MISAHSSALVFSFQPGVGEVIDYVSGDQRGLAYFFGSEVAGSAVNVDRQYRGI